MGTPKYGIRWRTVRYYMDEGKQLSQLVGFPFVWSKRDARVRTLAETTATWSRLVDLNDARTIGHEAIVWASTMSPATLKRVFSGQE